MALAGGGGWCARARRGIAWQCCDGRRKASRGSTERWGRSTRAGGRGCQAGVPTGGAWGGATAFPECSPESPLHALGPFTEEIWARVQGAPEAEFARSERWYGLGLDLKKLTAWRSH